MQAMRSVLRLFGRDQPSSTLTPARREVLNHDILRLVIKVSDDATLAMWAVTNKLLSNLALNRLYEVLDNPRLRKMEPRADWEPRSWRSLGAFWHPLEARATYEALLCDPVAHP